MNAVSATVQRQGPATLARRILLQGKYESLTMLRNGEQLILAVVLPLLALVGLTVTPLLDGLGAEPGQCGRPGHPGTVRHVHGLHRPRHRHRFRPPVRRSAVPFHHAAGPRRG